jgi:hypothetical protein
MSIHSLQYPIGKCLFQENYTPEQRKQYTLDIETFPMRLEHIVQHLNEQQLQARYRPGGWTIHQLIHHCADSHMNALLRIKSALTDEDAQIKGYDEDRWTQTADYTLPFNNSVTLLFALHRKLHTLIKSLDETDLAKRYYHLSDQRFYRVSDIICLYAWHGNHHLAHICQAIENPIFE